MNPLIELKNISYKYQNLNKKVIANLTTEFYQNQLIAIIGANGSGKSTLVKLLNALLLPTDGIVVVDNIETTDSTDAVWNIRKTVGMVFQNPENQFVANTVEEDIAFGMENQGVKTSIMRETVDDVLKEINLDLLRDKEPKYLSGGQKQKVAIAGILAQKPKVIIFDEATSMLDPKGRHDVLSLIQEICTKNNIMFIHITHYMEEALLANRIIVMDKGQIILDGAPEKIFKHRDLLLNIGLEVPVTVELSARLKERGFNIKSALTVEEFIDNLWI